MASFLPRIEVDIKLGSLEGISNLGVCLLYTSDAADE